MKLHLFMILLITGGLFSQTYAQWSVGLKAGPTRAWENYGPDVTTPVDANIHVNRFQASLMIYRNLNSFLRLGIEPGYVQRGAACEPGFIQFVGDTRLLLNYADLPVYIMPHVALCKGKIELFGKAGYGLSRALKASRVVAPLGGGDVIHNQLSITNGEEITAWDTGCYGGVGGMISFGGLKFVLEASYYHGLRHANKWFFSQNRNLSLSAGFLTDL